MANDIDLGVSEVAKRIHQRLLRYLEAQYHVRNSSLIEERRLLLEEPGGISQRPYIEVTPSYEIAGSFRSLKAPKVVTSFLQELADWQPGIGVYPPYRHQADALEEFFAVEGAGKDLVVATGTGSGKTETFLYSILGALAMEAEERGNSFQKPGVRALLLYPMNALVSDQTARLRRLVGDERLSELMRERWGRQPLFGMYTSRTPYPGVRTGAKDQRHLDSLLGYYNRLDASSDPEEMKLVAELKKRGRWPAKNVRSFYAKDLETRVTIKTGKNAGKERTLHNWGDRFRTDPEDRELMTRHEMHKHAPDILISNYSMLEYMLLRPIERPLFQQTREWLASDARNQFLLILDEAHMYRGVGGAEVGLLIRRLLSRLGIGRDRLRCILTSASLGTGAMAELAGRKFAQDLTGESEIRNFGIVRGTREKRSGARPGTLEEAKGLALISPTVLASSAFSPNAVNAALSTFSEFMSFPAAPEIGSSGELPTRQHVCKWLTGFGPLELLLESASGNATDFSSLASTLFPETDQNEAERATDGLLALGTFARRLEPGRSEQPLLPTRIHLMFRGLPSLHACINPKCTVRRNTTQTSLLGRIYTEPRTQCLCGGRIYELLTHRDCGAAFLRAFVTSPTSDFLWHEHGGNLTDFGNPLHEIHLFLEEPHSSQSATVDPVLLHVKTGRLLPVNRTDVADVRLVYRARQPVDKLQNTTTFASCPACTRNTMAGGSLKIMDLATKGEQPFANLVREQFVSQVATKPPSEQHPNEGRKALLFSDGRQKAARLARDLPREVERDSFREALVLACKALGDLSTPRQAILNSTMYAAFVSICANYHLHFFDGHSQEALIDECARFRQDYSDLELALGDQWAPTPPTAYRTALLRQISDPYYSLIAACAAVVEITPQKIRLLENRLTQKGVHLSADTLNDIANGWLKEMLTRMAFDDALGKDARQDEFPFFREVKSADGLNNYFSKLRDKMGLPSTDVDRIRNELFSLLTRDDTTGADSGSLVTADAVRLRLALDDTWLQCSECGSLQIKAFFGECENCQGKTLLPISPEHEYMRSRKGFFREPLRSVLSGERPVHITVEEHTAQLSQRDAGVIYATTEEFELRFQDVPLGAKKPPVDILSCTTTMEVGIDIGSLTAVGLRTVPPQRENYQQRAGRAGRRGTSVSSVVMFAQGGPHDSYYFANPKPLISGPPREPRLKADNPRLARRHVNSYLLQTFFHSILDQLSSEGQDRLARERPTIMSALGSANEFFRNNGDFSLTSFDRWIRREILKSNSAVVDDAAQWLPSAIFSSGSSWERQSFVRSIADDLLQSLKHIETEYVLTTGGDEEDESHDEDESEVSSEENAGLLDICFQRGLLPSYAFPTDLSSFVIQEEDRTRSTWRINVKERPQLAKAQALSEYAPGRLLVVNKKTYRVGGIFIDGPASASPATVLFAKPLNRYVGCPRCSYVTIELGNSSNVTTEGSSCPVCGTPVFVREYLDPPAFSPEGAKSVKDGDRDQDVTFASSAQLPEIASREEFEWRDGPGTHLSHAYREDVLLVVANKGVDSSGFSVCESCGATWIDGQEPAGAHVRPFLVSRRTLERDNATWRCTGNLKRGLFLVHEFRTDLLLLRCAIGNPLEFVPTHPWLNDGLTTLAEALALGTSLDLDIDPSEVSAGYRLYKENDKSGVAELYLFDTASGGAGYAAEAGDNLSRVLDRTEELLRVCPSNCQKSCTQCLRHYGNRFLHSKLDRRIALQLLRFFRFGEVPAFMARDQHSSCLRPLARYLELEGWNTVIDRDTGAMHCSGPRTVIVATYPAIIDPVFADRDHPSRSEEGVPRVLLPDYLIENDLPSAYQQVVGHGSNSVSYANVTEVESSSKVNEELDVIELSSSGRGGDRKVTLAIEPGAGATSALQIPPPGLSGVGFEAGTWVATSAVQSSDLDGNKWIVVTRARGNFGASGRHWTVARVREIAASGSNPPRLQLSYGLATGAAFRPERIPVVDLTLVATVICRGREVI